MSCYVSFTITWHSVDRLHLNLKQLYSDRNVKKKQQKKPCLHTLEIGFPDKHKYLSLRPCNGILLGKIMVLFLEKTFVQKSV